MEQILAKNFMKAPEYAKKYGLPVSRVRQMCEAGMLDAYRDRPGGHWYIRDSPMNTVSRDEYDKLRIENEKLKEKLSAIMVLCGH